MTKQLNQNERTTEPKTEFKFLSPPRQVEIVERAIAAVLDNFSKVEAAKDEVGKIEGGQLGVLATALKDIPEPVTEEAWDTLFRDKVADLLENAPVNGKPRYANKASRNVMVNLFKVATMGLTLAKQSPAYDPAATSATNLKKYATLIRPMLQADPDPATGEPRLSSGAPKKPKAPKKLTGDTYYWLVGCVDSEPGLNGIVGKSVVVCGEHDFRKLDSRAAELAGAYPSFGYIVGELKPMPIETCEMAVNLDVGVSQVEVVA
jgi:hypothetical protein